jgi:phage-related protein (TIGR01555 family)
VTTKRLTKSDQKAAAKLASLRKDAWTNITSGLGTSRDKSYGTHFVGDCIQSEAELETLFRHYHLARTGVSQIVTDSLRVPPCLEVDTDEDQEDEDENQEARAKKERALKTLFRDHDVWAKYALAAIWGRLFGRGALVFNVQGAGDPSKPWEPGRGTVKEMFVASSPELRVKDWYNDPMSAKFGTPAVFWLTRRGIGAVASTQMAVHESRMVLFGGADTAPETRAMQQGMDDSVLVAAYETLKQAGANWANISSMIHDMSVAVYKLQGFIDSLAGEGRGVLDQRFLDMDRRRSANRAVVIDKDGEEFDYAERGAMTGLDGLVDKGWLGVASAFRMPVTKLLGQSPAGMNATGEGDDKVWKDECGGWLSKEVEPRARKIAKALDPSTDWKVEFPDLLPETALEKEERLAKRANTDKIYYDMGAVLPEEVALARFGQDSELGIEIDLDVRESMLEKELTHAEEIAGTDPVAEAAASAGGQLPAPGAGGGKPGAAGAKGGAGKVPAADKEVAE